MSVLHERDLFMIDEYYPSNAHTHSLWCDGKNTTEEMTLAAIELGFTDLGFSSHSPAPFDDRCLGISDEVAYRNEIDELESRYDGRITLTCGCEQDYYAPVDRGRYEYIINSTHYLPREYEGAPLTIVSQCSNSD